METVLVILLALVLALGTVLGVLLYCLLRVLQQLSATASRLWWSEKFAAEAREWSG